MLYINTESYGLTNHREMVKLVKEKEGGFRDHDGESLPGSEESDCSLTDIPDKVHTDYRTFIIIVTTLILYYFVLQC